MLDTLRQDIGTMRSRRGGKVGLVVFPQVTSVALYRLSRALWTRNLRPFALVVFWINQLLTGAELHPKAQIGPGLVVVHSSGIVVGEGAVLGSNVVLCGGAVIGNADNGGGYPVLSDGAVIYAKASVLGDVRVGINSRVGAHALCLRDVPDDRIAVGVPAVVLD